MAITTLVKQGCFDADVEGQINTNFAAVAQLSPSSQQTGGINLSGVVKASGYTETPVALSGATDAISPHGSGNYVVTKAGVDAMTLAAPTAGTDDGVTITVTSTTANAHTITATSLLNNGGSGVPYTTATFAAHAGATITLLAYNALWYVISTNNVTLT